MTRAKADKLTTEQRTEAVYRLILDGWTVEQILQNSSKSWRVSDRQVYKYIDKAWERVEAVAAPQREEHLNRAIAAMYQLQREAKTIKDKIAIWNMLARLMGLYRQEVALATPMPMTVVVGAADLSGLGEAELDAVIRNLQAALSAGDD